jgi:hypothetical protein
MSDEEIIAELSWQHERYRGSGTTMERVLRTAAAALTRLRLTDEERAAVATAMNDYAADNADPECAKIEATLWGLLERL